MRVGVTNAFAQVLVSEADRVAKLERGGVQHFGQGVFVLSE